MKSVAIVLNGASSSGKTSIARAMQRISLTPVMHASLDTFTDMFYWPAIVDQAARKECHRVGVANFHSALSVLAANRYPLVVDHVFEERAWFEACRDALKQKKVFFVGVHCPLALLEEREKVRGDRRIGLAKAQFEQVHRGQSYDLWLDTSVMRPDECAAAVLVLIAKQAGAKMI
jgi:chloramphenicol 3-O phosphotransferase